MERFFLATGSVLATLALSSGLAHADAFARSFASNGGSAHSSSVAHGNADVEAHASAVRGRAEAHIEGNGFHGGFSRGRSVASTVGGYACSRGLVDARGHRAFAELDSVASSHFGAAISTGESITRGRGRSHAYSTALSHRGHARSDSRAVGIGRHGGVAEVVADSLADSRGHAAVSQVGAYGEAHGFHSHAGSESLGVSIARHRSACARANTESRAFNSCSRAQSAHFDYGY